MEPDKNTPETEQHAPVEEPQAPTDALSRTPDELQEEQTQQAAANPQPTQVDPAVKKISPIKKFFRKVNLYFLIFLLLLVIAGVIAAVNYLNSQKATPEAAIASQNLSNDALKQLANTDASVGDTSQTLTIQGNAIIAGQTLMRGNLNVAGNFQSGGSIQGPSLTISGAANLGETQVNSLQVATNTAIQGSTTLRDLNVAGTASFSGPITASQLTVTNLIMSGNASLTVPNHISFSSGPTPGISRGNALGNGGSTSINGSDTSGTINVTTGGNAHAGCYATVTFHQAFTSQPHITIGPTGYGAGVSGYYIGNLSKSGFQICAATPPSNQAFAFDYFVAD